MMVSLNLHLVHLLEVRDLGKGREGRGGGGGIL